MQDILIDNSDNKLSKELEEILEGSFDGILVTDKDTNVLYVNKSYERVAEIPLSDLVGHSMKELYNPVWMPTSVASIVVKEKKPVSKRQVVKSGRHIMVTGRPVFDEDGEVKKVVINARDISEIYDLREELLETRAVTKMYTDRFDYDDADFIEKEGGLVAVSKQIRQIISLAEKIAPFQATVLILGESGVGKEEVAKFIHKHSTRSDKPFIPINCGAIPHDLLESELFGYERGAFTGAMNTGKEGLIEAAEGGTIFLDEIGETTLDFQVKLLRFLETREIRKVGSTSSKTVDVRVIAATNKDLYELVQEGKFRDDLFYRLNVVQIDVPPLSERIDDIMPLANLFLNRFNRKYSQEKVLTYDLVKALESHKWVGNVRELKNVIENMVVVSNNEYLQTEDLPWHINLRSRWIDEEDDEEPPESFFEIPLNEAMENYEREILERTHKKYGSTRIMADKLKVNQSTIVRKMQKYGIK